MAEQTILNSEWRRRELIERILKLPIVAGMPIFEVQIQKYRKIRSYRQNKLYWMWLNIISDYNGDDPDDLHQFFKGEFLGYETRDVFNRPTAIPISTTGLSTKKFSEYLDKIEEHAGKFNIVLPHPQDYKWIMNNLEDTQ